MHFLCNTESNLEAGIVCKWTDVCQNLQKQSNIYLGVNVSCTIHMSGVLLYTKIEWVARTRKRKEDIIEALVKTEWKSQNVYPCLTFLLWYK